MTAGLIWSGIWLKVILNPYHPWEKKKNYPLNLISGFATLDGNDCSQVFALTVNEPFTSLWNTFFPTPLWKMELIQQ